MVARAHAAHARVDGGELRDDAARAVPARIVDHDDLVVDLRAGEGLHDGADGGIYRADLVVGGDDDRQLLHADTDHRSKFLVVDLTPDALDVEMQLPTG